MESIKITDKVTLRQEALRMAVDFISATKTGAGWQGIADSFESYLQGSAELPERDNGMEKYLQELKDSVLNFKNNPWISADSEMKPAKGTPVICALHYGISNIEYVVMYYNHEEKEWCGGNDDDNTNHVVAWCPIQPFTQPTL